MPEDPTVDRHATRQFGLQGIELSIQSCRELHGVGIRLFLDRHDHGRRAVSRSLPPFERTTFAHVRHVTNQYRPIATKGDDAVANLIRRANPADGLQDVLLWPLPIDAGGGVLARTAHTVQELCDRDVVGTELIGMRDDLELALVSTDRRHLRHPSDREESPADHSVSHGAQRERVILI